MFARTGVKCANDVASLRRHLLGELDGEEGVAGEADKPSNKKPVAGSGHDVQILARIETVEAVKAIDEIMLVRH